MSVHAHVIIVSRDALPRPVWEEEKIFSLPDWSGNLKLFFPSQTSLARNVNIHPPRPVWEHAIIYFQPDQSGKKGKCSAYQTGLGGKKFMLLARLVWE